MDDVAQLVADALTLVDRVVAVVTTAVDNNGHELEVAYFDEEENPMLALIVIKGVYRA